MKKSRHDLVYAMSRIKISPEAVKDLENIQRYISNELKNPLSARRVVQKIMNDIRVLESYKEAGPSIESLTGYGTDLRLLVCHKYIAVYKVEDSDVLVARIIHAKQDYMRVLFQM